MVLEKYPCKYEHHPHPLITNSALWMQTTAAKCTQSGNFKGSAEMVSGMTLSWFENVCRAFLVTQTNIFSGTKYVLAASWCLLRGQSHPGAIPYPQSISRELILPLALHCGTTHNQTKYSVSPTQRSTKITTILELLAPQIFLAPLPIIPLSVPLHKNHYLALLLAPKHLAAGPRDYLLRWLPSSE